MTEASYAIIYFFERKIPLYLFWWSFFCSFFLCWFLTSWNCSYLAPFHMLSLCALSLKHDSLLWLASQVAPLLLVSSLKSFWAAFPTLFSLTIYTIIWDGISLFYFEFSPSAFVSLFWRCCDNLCRRTFGFWRHTKGSWSSSIDAIKEEQSHDLNHKAGWLLSEILSWFLTSFHAIYNAGNASLQKGETSIANILVQRKHIQLKLQYKFMSIHSPHSSLHNKDTLNTQQNQTICGAHLSYEFDFPTKEKKCLAMWWKNHSRRLLVKDYWHHKAKAYRRAKSEPWNATNGTT